MSMDSQDDNTTATATTATATTFLQKMRSKLPLIGVSAWIFVGIAAVVMNFIWFGFGEGAISEKIVGALVILILGPIYFILYKLKRDMCPQLGAGAMAGILWVYSLCKSKTPTSPTNPTSVADVADVADTETISISE